MANIQEMRFDEYDKAKKASEILSELKTVSKTYTDKLEEVAQKAGLKKLDTYSAGKIEGVNAFYKDSCEPFKESTESLYKYYKQLDEKLNG